ncbi:MAG TPA: hypothetical protein VGB84_05825 [Arachidicoccus sp.]
MDYTKLSVILFVNKIHFYFMDKEKNEIIILLNSCGVIKDKIGEEDFLHKMINAVEYFINKDFTKLTEILYRVDVDEKKLKENIAQAPATDASEIIARMLLERHQQKLALRKKFKQPSDHISEDEKW